MWDVFVPFFKESSSLPKMEENSSIRKSNNDINDGQVRVYTTWK
jgi:hypothetical protein